MKCPNCGQEFEGERCPRCGRPALSRAGRVTAVILLVFLALPAAAFGACSAVVAVGGAQGPGRNDKGTFAMFGLMALAGFGAFVGILAWVRTLWRS